MNMQNTHSSHLHVPHIHSSHDEYLMISHNSIQTHLTIWKKPFTQCEGVFHIAVQCPNHHKKFHEWLAVRDKKIIVPLECKLVNENLNFKLPCPEIITKYNEEKALLIDMLLSLI